jgi:hypothetical protein
MRFSNPTFSYNGLPIGNAQNNNAKVLNDNSAAVAGYYSRAPTNEPTTSPSLQPTSPTVTKYVCGKFQPANDEICANGSVADATCDAEKAASGVSCGNGRKKCWQADGCVGSSPTNPPTASPTVNCVGIQEKSACDNEAACVWEGNPKNGQCKSSTSTGAPPPPPAPTPPTTPQPTEACVDAGESCSVGSVNCCNGCSGGKPSARKCL